MTQKFPENWTKTIDNLFDEEEQGLRENISDDELEWAKNYELSLLPKAMRFPRKGDVYECLEERDIEYLTIWENDEIDGGDTQLQKGDRLLIGEAPEEQQPLGVYLEAFDYDGLEKRMIPAKERKDPTYGGFFFFIDSLDLYQNFKLINR